MFISNRVSKGNVVYYKIAIKEDLIVFLNEALKPKTKWLDIGDELNNQFMPMYDSNETVTKKQWYTKWSTVLKPYSNPRQLKYWLIRGYSQEYANHNITQIQSKAGQSFSKKIKENPGKYKDYTPTQIGYWLKKGFSHDEAKIQVSKRQMTFSLERCIVKWGLTEGTNRFNQRQDKWQESLNNSKGITWSDCDKDCRSLSTFETLTDLIDAYLTYSFISNEVKVMYQKILDLNITKSTTLLEEILKFNFNDVLLISNLRPIQDFLQKSKYEIISHWANTNAQFKKTKWGNLYYHEDHYFQSTCEWIVGLYLINNKIEFSMHKRYPVNEIFFYDFYLPKYDIYIEYCGRDLKSYNKKKGFLEKQNFSIIWDSSVDKILDEIKLLIIF